MPLQIRRGTELQRQAMTVPLAAGELLYVTDDQRLYVGNGTTLGGVQITGYNDENAQDAIATLFNNGDHTGITFTYNDLQNKLSATVDLSNYTGTIGASAFKGSLFGDDSTVIVDALEGRVFANLTGNVTGNVSGNVSGNLTGNVSGNITGVITGTAGSSLVGNVTGDLLGYQTGDMTGSVFGDDSTLLVDAVSNRLSNGTITINDNDITSASDIVINNFCTFKQNGIEIASSNPTSAFSATTVLVDVGTQSSSPSVHKASRGSISSPTINSSNDLIHTHNWQAHDGTSFVTSAFLGVQIDSVATGDVPGKIFLLSVPNGDTTTGKGIQITENGVAINNSISTPPAATLDVNGFAKLAVLTSAPATPADGMIAIADGSSWDPAGTGKSVMVVHLSGGWRVAATAP